MFTELVDFSPESSLSSAELYHPDSNKWSSAGFMSVPRVFATATLLGNGKVLIAGGRTATPDPDSYLSNADVYDPVSNTWFVTASMSTMRCHHWATLLNNGKVLVAGGNTPGGESSSAELYDPS